MKKAKISILLIASACCLASCNFSGILVSSKSSTSSNYSQPIVRGVALYRTDTGELLSDGDSIEIETYYDFYFTLKYNGEVVNARSITSSDESIVFPHSKSVYPRSEGTVTLTIRYLSNTNQETTYTLQVKSTHHKNIQSIYVGNAENGIKLIGDDQVRITGKVFAKYENGVVRAINNDEDLSTTVSEGKDIDHKKVTLSYASEDITKTVSYEVPVSSSKNEIQRTELTQGFGTYYDNGLYRNYPTVKTEGDLRILAIPVWFTDSSNFFNPTSTDHNGKTQKEQVLEDLNYSLFGTPLRQNEQTLRSYYYDESFGRLNISGTVSDWYNASFSSSTNYFSDSYSRETLFKNAYDWYFSSTGESQSDYDCVLFSYGSNHYGDASNGYTAFQASIKDSSRPYLKRTLWVSSLSLYGIASGETDYLSLNDLSDNCSNDATYQTTIIHEFAHSMGAIDIYSDQRVNGIKNVPGGRYSMQAEDRCGHDTFNMLGLGWASPYVLSADENYGKTSITLTIDDLQSSGDCVILSPSWNGSDSPFGEYIAIDLFAETGVNTFQLASNGKKGLRVYHVDSRLYDVYANAFTSDATNSGVVMPFTNTAGVANASSNYPVLSQFADMDAVHMIRHNNVGSKGNEIGYITSDLGHDDAWFQAGDTFSMSKYAKQFYSEGELDSGLDLGWEFEVNSIAENDNGGASAVITFTKTSVGA